MRLEGKVAIITGAASGIGAGTAERFVEEGCRLVLVDWDEALLRERWEHTGDEVVLCPGDVAEKSTAERAVALAIERFGRLDILFNNAGIMTYGDFLGEAGDDWDRLLGINLRGIMLMCRAALPHMLERGSGSIISTSSVMATLTEPGYEAYTTSKAGIIGLTRALAVSYAETGIRVNCICPGWIDTPMNVQLAEELGGMDKLIPILRRQQPNGRMITTREVANVVLFLASDESTGMTGSAVYVDGGASAAI
jgi:NAD(P)-dependent dehydrogenase (short-subunit alcohol dehydrogenase family)